jgi:hypothetical protein
MKRTNAQVKKDVARLLGRYDLGSEPFHKALTRYWIKYELTAKQCQYLNEIKNELVGPRCI